MMKTVLKKKITPKPFYCLLTMLLFVITGSIAKAGDNLPSTGTRSAILVNKAQNSKKHKIRLYSDAARQWLLFTVDGIAGSDYQLYIFDMDGRLVTQANIHNRETTVLNAISRGDYLFEVLMNDREVEHGRLLVK